MQHLRHIYVYRRLGVFVTRFARALTVMKFSSATSNSTAGSPFKPTMADDRAACAHQKLVSFKFVWDSRASLSLKNGSWNSKGMSIFWLTKAHEYCSHYRLSHDLFIQCASRRASSEILQTHAMKRLAARTPVLVMCTAPDKIDRKLLKNILGRNFLRLTDRPRARTCRQARDRSGKNNNEFLPFLQTSKNEGWIYRIYRRTNGL